MAGDIFIAVAVSLLAGTYLSTSSREQHWYKLETEGPSMPGTTVTGNAAAVTECLNYQEHKCDVSNQTFWGGGKPTSGNIFITTENDSIWIISYII